MCCCLHGQSKGNSSLKHYSLEKTEKPIDYYVYGRFNPVLWSSDNSYHYTQFLNKVSDIFKYKFKVLKLFMSNINCKNNDEIQNSYASIMPAKQLFSNNVSRKIEKNISKRIPREIIKTLTNKNVMLQSTTFSSVPSISIMEIKNQFNLNHSLTTHSISTFNTSKSTINLTSTLTPLNISIDTSLIFSTINSTPMTNNDIPLISSIAVNNIQTFQNNITNKDKIKIFPDFSPDKRKFLSFLIKYYYF